VWILLLRWFFVEPARNHRGQNGAQPHLDHPAKWKTGVAGEPDDLRVVIREAGEKADKKADLQCGARTRPQTLPCPGVQMRDCNRQNKQNYDPLDYEERIARRLQKESRMLGRRVA